MPTVAERPSLAETQAIGLTLLHQFARQRGIDDGLIREAEAREHLDILVNSLYDEDEQNLNELDAATSANCGRTSLNETTSASTFSNCSNSNNTTIQNPANETHNRTEERFHSMANDDEQNLDESNSTTSANCSRTTLNETTSASMFSNGSNSINMTIQNPANETHNMTEERYHSMVNSSMAIGTRQDDSINTGNQSRTTAAASRFPSTPSLEAYGRELRRMADDFEKSRFRKTVQQRAKNVKLSDITKESFIGLLEELFKEEITREKIVILFFFCTDVALEAFSFGSSLVSKLLGWSFSYIINTVCSFVYKLGGWDKVLFYQFPSMLISCCAALAAMSLFVYLKNNLLRG